MIEIEKGLVLNNPTIEIVNISYPQKTNEVIVECYFSEENSTFNHSRNYTFDNLGGSQLNKPDVIEMMKSNEVLNKLL